MLTRLLTGLVGGLLLWVSFPGYDIWAAAPLGVALSALSLRDIGATRGALLGFAGGMAFFTPLLSWAGIYVGPGPWLALAVLQSLYHVILGVVLGFVRVRDRYFPFLVGGAWVTTELARSTTPFGGFPWARLAFGQADSPFAGVASLVGAPGVTGVVAVTGGILAVLLSRLVDLARCRKGSAEGGGSRPVLRSLAVPAAAVVLLVLLPTWVPRPTDGPTARIMAIQGDVPQAGLDFNAQRRAVLDNHAQLTKQAAEDLRRTGGRTPDLVLWPENASDIDPLRNSDAARVIGEAVSAIGAPTVVGAVLSEPADHVTNAALVYVPGKAEPVQRYDKRHPVPFGEYIPYRDFFRNFSDKVDLVKRDFVGGKEIGVLTAPRSGGVPEVAAGATICFEVAYDDLVRDSVSAGANIVIVQTNNATFGRTHESVQQLAISRIRAIEHGRSVVHISNVGVSSLITPDGAPHGWTELFTKAVLQEDLPLRSGLTWATRLGDYPAIGTSVLTLALTCLALVRHRRRMV